MAERTYKEDEIREIFADASEASQSSLPAVRENEPGLTLSELQEVGREVGLAPEAVAAAAARLQSRPGVVPRRTALGAPVSAGRVVDLPRAPTDREWEVLVTELRETFHARGRLTGSGNLREWSNGNLHACIEPSGASGYRLRMGTHKTGAVAPIAIGGAGAAIGLALLATSGLDAATFRALGAILIPIIFILIGGGVVYGNVRQLRAWADEREAQMDHIAHRAITMLTEEADT